MKVELPSLRSAQCFALRAGLLVALAILCYAPSAQAASGTWNGTNSGAWSDAGNWSASPAPTTADTATFNNAGNSNTSITIDSGRTVKLINFDTSAVAYTIGSAGVNAGNTLTLASAGGISLLSTMTSTATETINAPLSLAGSVTLTNSTTSGAKLVIAGDITNTVTSTITLAGAPASGTAVNVISGSIKDGTGVTSVTVNSAATNAWELTGANSYSGTTTVNFANANGGGAMTFSGSNSSSGATTLSKGIINLNSATNGGLASGSLTLTAGTLQALNATRSLSNAVNLSAVTVSGSQSINLNGKLTGVTGASRTLTSSISGGTLTLSDVDINTETANARVLTIAGTGSTVISGTIANGNGTTANGLTITNTGITTLSGTGSYTGDTTLNAAAGTLQFNSASNGGMGTGGTLILTAGSLQALNATRSISNPISLTAVTVSGSQSLNLNGKLTGTAGGGRTLTSSISGGTLTLSDVDINADTGATRNLTIAGTGNTTITGTIANGNGSVANGVTISNTAVTTLNGTNSYTGTTTVQTGATLKIGANNSINSGNALTTSGTGVFDLNGFNQTLGLLNNGTGATVTNSSGTTRTLTIGDGSTGAGSFTGAMNVVFNLGAGNSTLSGSFGNNGSITNSGAGAGTATISGVIGTSVTGVLQNSASSTLVLSGANVSFAGGVTIKSGTVSAQLATALGTAAVTLGDTTGSASATLLSNNSSNALRTFTNDINVVSGSSGTKTLASAGNSGNTATTYSGSITLADNLAIGGSTGAGTLTLSGPITGNGFSVTNTGVSPAAISGVVGTGVTIVQDSAGSLAISGANTNVYTVLFKQGTGSVGVGSMDNATLAINTGAALTFGHVALSIGGFNDGASGGGSFADSTAGTARAVTLAGSGTYSFSGTLGSVAVPAMSLIKGGAGTQTFSGASLYTGATTVSGGTLIAGADALVSTAGPFGNAASALTLGDANTTTNNSSPSLLSGGAFTIARAVTVANQATSGTYRIGGNTNNSSTFSGLITANQNLTISQVATTGSNALNITGGITGASATAKTLSFAGPGAINVSSTGISNGAGTVGVSVTGGTTTFSVANSYTGATSVSSGTLLISGAGTINTSSGVTITGGTLDYQNNTTALNRNITLNGGTFKNNSSQAYAGTLTFTSGTVGGTNLSGVALSIGANQTISPGNSPGTMSTGAQTWLDNGNYNWQLVDATGTAGSGFDTVDITGGLNLAGLTGSPDFNINLWTLSSIGPDVNGNATNFIDGNNYTWKLVSTTTGITGFNAANFLINTTAANGTTGFSNPFTGSFSVAVSGNDLNLVYTAVPEPATWALLAFSLTSVLVLRRRRS